MFPALGKLRCVFVQPNIKQLNVGSHCLGGMVWRKIVERGELLRWMFWGTW